MDGWHEANNEDVVHTRRTERGTYPVRFYLDPETGQPHIYNHGITENEVRQVFAAPCEDLPGDRSSRMRLG